MTDDPIRANAQGQTLCVAHNRGTDDLCRGVAMRGGTLCRLHGGAAPQTKARAEVRIIEQQAKQTASEMVIEYRGEFSGDPLDALLDMVRTSAMAVAAYAQMVKEAGHVLLAVSYGVQGKRAEAHPIVKLWSEERDRLVRFSKVALDAGVAEREVRMAEATGVRIIETFQAALRNPRLGLTIDQQRVAQECIGEVVRAQIGEA